MTVLETNLLEAEVEAAFLDRAIKNSKKHLDSGRRCRISRTDCHVNLIDGMILLQDEVGHLLAVYNITAKGTVRFAYLW